MDIQYFNMVTTYFSGNVVRYKDDNYKVEIPKNEKLIKGSMFGDRCCVIGECPDVSRYFTKCK